MARKLDPKVADTLKQFGFDHTAAWDCHGVWVVYHRVLEQIAAKAGVKFSAPQIIEADGGNGIAAICVSGTYQDRAEWSIGEAAPKNNKNAYPWAMAEKRAKDRVILKLIGLHGLAYSEEEADDFKQRMDEESDHRTPEAILADFLDRVENINDAGDYARAWKEELPSLSKIGRNFPEQHAAFKRDLNKIIARKGFSEPTSGTVSGNSPPPATDPQGTDKGSNGIDKKTAEVDAKAKKKADEIIAAIERSPSLGDACSGLFTEGLADIDDGVWRLDKKTPLDWLSEARPHEFQRIKDAYNAIQKKEIAA